MMSERKDLDPKITLAGTIGHENAARAAVSEAARKHEFGTHRALNVTRRKRGLRNSIHLDIISVIWMVWYSLAVA